MQYSLNRLSWVAAGAMSLIVSVAFCIALLTLPEAPAEFLHSDALYLPALFRDIDTVGLGGVAKWNLTPNPYFFPESKPMQRRPLVLPVACP